MLNKFRNLFNTEDKKRLLSNFISLSSLQAVNYILPLITFPYLIRVLGIEKFGLLTFATAVIAYFNIITDYGFNLTATRAIAINRNRPNRLNQIISSVIIIKLTLMMLSFCLLCLLVFSFDKFRDEALIYLLTFGTVVGQVLFPVWFFQGMERMKYITYLNIVSKVIFTLAIFIFVNQESDYYLVPVFTSVGYIIAGLLSLSFIITRFHIKFSFQKMIILKYYLKDGWHVFLSRIYVSLYTTTNVFLLGIFTNNTIVGYYAATEKIVLAISGLFDPVNQTIYPYLAKVYRQNFSQFKKMIKKIAFTFLVIALFLFITSEFLKDYLVYIVSGSYNEELSFLLSIFLIRIITSPFGGFFSNTLIIMQKKRDFLKVMNYTVLINFLIVPFAIYKFSVLGLIIGFIFVHINHVLALFYFYMKNIKNRY